MASQAIEDDSDKQRAILVTLKDSMNLLKDTMGLVDELLKHVEMWFMETKDVYMSGVDKPLPCCRISGIDIPPCLLENPGISTELAVFWTPDLVLVDSNDRKIFIARRHGDVLKEHVLKRDQMYIVLTYLLTVRGCLGRTDSYSTRVGQAFKYTLPDKFTSADDEVEYEGTIVRINIAEECIANPRSRALVYHIAGTHFYDNENAECTQNGPIHIARTSDGKNIHVRQYMYYGRICFIKI